MAYFIYCILFLKGDTLTKLFVSSFINCILYSISLLTIICGCIFVNGDASSYEALKSYVSSSYVVIYYNQTAKTIWAYIADEDVQSGRCAVRGTVENIYYSSSDVMTPISITLDDGQEYNLSSSEMQFAFSVYGSIRVGDRVTLICEKSENSNGDATYTVVDYVED